MTAQRDQKQFERVSDCVAETFCGQRRLKYSLVQNSMDENSANKIGILLKVIYPVLEDSK